jgi:hypothetical protein
MGNNSGIQEVVKPELKCEAVYDESLKTSFLVIHTGTKTIRLPMATVEYLATHKTVWEDKKQR